MGRRARACVWWGARRAECRDIERAVVCSVRTEEQGEGGMERDTG